MVIARQKQSGWLVAELMIAVGIIAVAMIPLAFSFRAEQKVVRANYNQTVAMEIIDGEMELLHAGEWRSLLEGEQNYKVTAKSATNLPTGRFVATRSNNWLRLEWRPSKRNSGGTISREIQFRHQP